jgi:CheY-like chemotaxis protein
LQPREEKRKARVLLVDDEEMIRTMGKRMISAAGHDVTLADSGSSALHTYRANAQEIDLVVLDLSMPEMDGAECFEKLREINPAVRVLICTGHGKRQDTEEMLARGARGMVRKPFDLDQLSEAIDGALDEQA